MFIGNEVFRMIVEMAYEMEYHDQCDREIKNACALVPGLVDTIQSNRNRKALRKVCKTLNTKDETYRSIPWRYNGKIYCHTLYQEYERYINEQGKVRERGILTLTVSEKWKDGRFLDVNHMYRREGYNDDIQFPLFKQVLKEKYNEMFSYRSVVKYFLEGEM